MMSKDWDVVVGVFFGALALVAITVAIVIGVHLGHTKAAAEYIECVKHSSETHLYIDCGSRP